MSDNLVNGTKERDVAGDLIPSIAVGGVITLIAGVLFSPWLLVLALSMFLLSGVMMSQYDWEDEESFSPAYDWKLIGGRDRTIEKHCELENEGSVCVECGKATGDGMEQLRRHEFVIGGIPISTEEHGRTYECEQCILESESEEMVSMDDEILTSADRELEALLEDAERETEVEKEYEYET